LIRKILGSLLRIDPRGIEFTTGAHGKPGIHTQYAGKPVYFNVSHTRNRVLFATTLGVEVGVDVEQIRPQVACEDLARRFFSPHESSALKRLPAETQHLAFFHCWARKEAVLKATGLGFALGLHAFEVS